MSSIANLRRSTRLSDGNSKISMKGKRHLDNDIDGGNKKRAVFNDVTNRKIVKNINKKPKLKKGKATLPVNDLRITESSSQESISPKSITEHLNVENIRLNNDNSLNDTKFEEAFDWINVDKIHLTDLYDSPDYAQNIFTYYLNREHQFIPTDYLKNNKNINANMRIVLVDWMIEIQENFELNHETLYLAVKMLDLYLSRTEPSFTRDKLQLLGATTMFIASKYDERSPPLLDDFLYICNDAYNRRQLIKMEMDILRTLEFDIGMPLSYRFLRRFARCCKDDMPNLALARYILEISLMEYNLISYLDSHIASAALLLAHSINNNNDWNPTVRYYSGYEKNDLKDLVILLNNVMKSNKTCKYKHAREKYSHSVFHSVAKKTPLTEDQINTLFNE